MRSVFAALMTYVASRFRSHESLRLENMALRHQLAVYQQSIKRPKLHASDRLFWAWLSRLWPGWQQALAFVQPRTVIAWQKQRFRAYWRRLSQRGKPGRPAIAKDVRELIQDMWRSHPTWGSPRIVGELRMLGITVAKSTVEKYRPRVRKPPSPTWKAFLNNHIKDIVACIGIPNAIFPRRFLPCAHRDGRYLDQGIMQPVDVRVTIRGGGELLLTDTKDKQKDKGWTCDLVPKPLIVARYFAPRLPEQRGL